VLNGWGKRAVGIVTIVCLSNEGRDSGNGNEEEGVAEKSKENHQQNNSYDSPLSCPFSKARPHLFSFCLKYSPSTDLIASGTVSSFRAFFSCSSAFSISFEMLTMTLFCAMPIGTNRYRYNPVGRYLLVGIGIWQSQNRKSRLEE